MANIKDKIGNAFSNGGELILNNDELFELEGILIELRLYKDTVERIESLMDDKGWDDKILDIFVDLEDGLRRL